MGSLFLALFPTAIDAQRIAAAVANTREIGPDLALSIRNERLHITIAHLGDRGDDADLIAAVSRAMDGMDLRPVDIELGRICSFGDRGNRPIVLRGRFDNAPTARRRGEVLAALEGVVDLPDADREYVPHVTLLYADAAVDVELPEGISLRCDSLALVRGGDYARLHERALTTAGAVEVFGGWHDNPVPSPRELTEDEYDDLAKGLGQDVEANREQRRQRRARDQS